MKRTDLDKARTFVGTCLDMCPEKERYMRETRSQLSVFEVVPGTDQVEPHIPVGCSPGCCPCLIIGVERGVLGREGWFHAFCVYLIGGCFARMWEGYAINNRIYSIICIMRYV